MTAGTRALVIALVAAGVVLRAWHLGTPGLWFDEVVEIRTAQNPTIGEVLAAVRGGARPTAGNAGAMPLDYLLLHGWLRMVPMPSAPWIEAYHRFPAFLASCATLPALALLAWRTLGPREAVVATALLASAVFHVLYAVEARYYAVLGVLTVVDLGAFAWLLAAPRARGRWAVFIAAGLASVLTGVYAVALLGWQYLVLMVGGAARRGLLVVGGCGALAVAAWWLGPVGLGTAYGRAVSPEASPLGEGVAMFRLFAGGNDVLAVMLAASIPVALWDAARLRRQRLPLLVASAAAVASVPALAWLAWRKGYYLHPRHVLFLMVPLYLLAAAGFMAIADRGLAGRPRGAMFIVLLLVVVSAAPAVGTYLRRPVAAFRQSKGAIELGAVMRDVADRVATFRFDERLLVLVERNTPGFMANPVVLYYLQSLGIGDRVVVRGFADVRALMGNLQRVCAPGCAGLHDVDLERRLDIGSPIGRPADIPRFLRLTDVPGRFPVRLGGVVVLVYSDFRTWTFPGVSQHVHPGVTLYAR